MAATKSKIAEHHTKAAEHHETAAQHHREAAKHHGSGIDREGRSSRAGGVWPWRARLELPGGGCESSCRASRQQQKISHLAQETDFNARRSASAFSFLFARAAPACSA